MGKGLPPTLAGQPTSLLTFPDTWSDASCLSLGPLDSAGGAELAAAMEKKLALLQSRRAPKQRLSIMAD